MTKQKLLRNKLKLIELKLDGKQILTCDEHLGCCATDAIPCGILFLGRDGRDEIVVEPCTSHVNFYAVGNYWEEFKV